MRERQWKVSTPRPVPGRARQHLGAAKPRVWRSGFSRRRPRAKPARRLPLLLLVVAGGWWLWQREPALRKVALGWLSLVQHAGWWRASGFVLLGVGLVGVGVVTGLWWLWRGHRKKAQRCALARQQHLRTLQARDPLAFERLVGRLFAFEGYRVSYTAYSGDEGIDLWLEGTSRTGWLAPLHLLKALVGGSRARRIPVQCKRYGAEHAVGSPDLQKFSGALRGALAEEGIFVTTSRFTPAAQAWARKAGIRLIDGAALTRWQVRLRRRVAREAALTPTAESVPGKEEVNA